MWNPLQSGGPSFDSYQYIGRNTDATGLYYFRNRYYNPITQTFLSEDPTRFAGGPNLYQNGAGNPTTYRGHVIDNLTSDYVAQEAKNDSQSLESGIIVQINNYVELMNTPGSGVNSVEWHFYPTANGGPSGPLLNHLLNNGIKIVWH